MRHGIDCAEAHVGRSETEDLKKTIATQRAELAALKRRVQTLEKALKLVVRMAAASKSATRQGLGEEGEGGGLQCQQAATMLDCRSFPPSLWAVRCSAVHRSWAGPD